MPSVDAIPLTSFVRDLIGPSSRTYARSRTRRRSGFPVYPGLAETLAGADAEKQPVAEIAHTLAVTAGYAYSDAGTLAMMMTRLGLERAYCREIARSVDAMFIRSTAFLIQSADGRVVILCYRGTPPLDLISWLLDADVTLPEPATEHLRRWPPRDAGGRTGAARGLAPGVLPQRPRDQARGDQGPGPGRERRLHPGRGGGEVLHALRGGPPGARPGRGRWRRCTSPGTAWAGRWPR